MTDLYELTEQYKKLAELANDPEVPAEAIADTIEGLEGEFNAKAVSVTHVLRNASADIESLDTEIKRLEARKKVIKNGQDRLKEYLRSNMEASGITKIDCPLFTITLAKGRDICVVENEKELPSEFIVTTTRPDKTALLKALKDGPVNGAHIEKSKPSLRIK